MTVTYRVFREENGQYTLREVFLENDGKIITYGRAPVTPKGGSLADLAQEIDWLKDALALPVLTLAEIETEITAQTPMPKRERKTISHAELVTKLGLDADDALIINDAEISHAAD